MGLLSPFRRASILLLCPLVACSGEKVLGDYPPCSCDLAEPPAQLRAAPLKIATFWKDKEDFALTPLTENIDARRYRVTRESLKTRDEVQQHIREAFVTRDPPDVFQVNGGSDVLRWVDGRASDETDICALDRLHATNEWKGSYFSEALEPLSCNGALFGLPVGIHHVNVLLYNRELFEQLKELAQDRDQVLAPPENIKDAFELLEWLEQVEELSLSVRGSPLIPLALGSADNWPLTLVAFENVLLGLTEDAYETIWMGGLEGAGSTRRSELTAVLKRMLGVVRGLVRVSNFQHGVTWQEAIQQVGSGQALLTINGDWAFAALPEEHKGGVQISVFPGTHGKFAYTPDSFAVPRDLEKNGFAARFFLRDVVGDKTTLLRFSNAKHAIPPRRDLDDADRAQLTYPSLLSTYDDFVRCTDPRSDCEPVLAVSGLAPPPGSDPCFDEIEALLRYAVTGVEPEHDPEDERLCKKWLFPGDSKEAEARLLEVLIGIGGHRFAEACR